MSPRCSINTCFAHEGETCALGERHLEKCPRWSAGSAGQTEARATPGTPSTTTRVSWSGSALGLADLVHLVPRARAIVIGVVGAHDAGKTTLLTGSYLELLRGQSLADARFAGSRTLGAWESLAAWARFDDAARKPSFPPHTPRGMSRVPGLLHLGLRGSRGEFRDVLLADAPGEWFTRWSVQEEAADAEGARWVARHADAFLVLADCARLCGDGRGQARSEIRQLLERLENHVSGRPTVLVWAKADHQPSDAIREAIHRSLNSHIPHAVNVETTIEQPSTLRKALEAALGPVWTPPQARPLKEPILQHEPFTAFRGSRAHT